jgi:hypothetical protein
VTGVQTCALPIFQEKNGLRKTGMLDIDTWRKLIAVAPVKGTDRDGDGVITPDEM